MTGETESYDCMVNPEDKLRVIDETDEGLVFEIETDNANVQVVLSNEDLDDLQETIKYWLYKRAAKKS